MSACLFNVTHILQLNQPSCIFRLECTFAAVLERIHILLCKLFTMYLCLFGGVFA